MHLDPLTTSNTRKQSNTLFEELSKVSPNQLKLYPAPDQTMYYQLFGRYIINCLVDTVVYFERSLRCC